MTDLERLALRPAEAARLLGVSGRTLWGWTRRGVIPFIRQGRIILYPLAALRAWLEEQSRTGTTAGVVSESQAPNEPT